MPERDIEFVRAQVPAFASREHGVLRLKCRLDPRRHEITRVVAAPDAAL